MDRVKLKQSRQNKDNILNAFIWAAAAVTVGFLFWIIWYILSNGLQHVDWNFITDNYTRPGTEHGIFPMIVATIYMCYRIDCGGSTVGHHDGNLPN